MERLTLLLALLVISTTSPADAKDALAPDIRRALKTVTRQLTEAMRQNVEVFDIEDRHLIEFPLTHTTSERTVLRSRGILVPFRQTGVDGGNSIQQFVALFVLMSPDAPKLSSYGNAKGSHKHVALLAFSQLNNDAKMYPDWSAAIVSGPGLVTVPVALFNCNGRHGFMTVHVDDNGVGPKIGIAYDADATLGPNGCALAK